MLPDTGETGYLFHDFDVARVRLIVELKRDLAIDEEAMPVLLNLLDQVYTMRRRMKALRAALAALPPESRAALQDALERHLDAEGA